MPNWPATKASKVLAALKRIGWKVKRHDGVEIWPGALARIGKATGLKPSDL